MAPVVSTTDQFACFLTCSYWFHFRLEAAWHRKLIEEEAQGPRSWSKFALPTLLRKTGKTSSCDVILAVRICTLQGGNCFVMNLLISVQNLSRKQKAGPNMRALARRFEARFECLGWTYRNQCYHPSFCIKQATLEELGSFCFNQLQKDDSIDLDIWHRLWIQ